MDPTEQMAQANAEESRLKNARMQAWLTRPGGLATMLRTARGQLSVRDLAKASGWGSSKVSKIETGQQIPTDEDLKLWARATKTAADTRKLWQAELDEVLNMRSTLRRRTTEQDRPDSGMPPSAIEAVSTLLRFADVTAIPPLLQTPAYALAYLLQTEASDDHEPSLAALVRRQQILSDPAKRFEFLLGESAVRYIPVKSEIMDEQLEHLLKISTARNVRLGVVPQMKPLARMPLPAAFALYDDEDAIVFTGVEDRPYTGSDVSPLHKGMDALWEEAIEGRGVRELLLSIKDLIARSPA